MNLSVFEIFKLGIGPSSSHTVGPMRAARFFTQALAKLGNLESVVRVQSVMYGSLGATGKGHGTDTAILLGLSGHDPETVDVDAVPSIMKNVHSRRMLQLGGSHPIAWDESLDLVLDGVRVLPFHTNGMHFSAYDSSGEILLEKTYYSVGGGFVVDEDQAAATLLGDDANNGFESVPYPFGSGEELLKLTRQECCSIAEIVRRNERLLRNDNEIDADLLTTWNTMQACVERGCRTEGLLPGPFKVRRRAASLAKRLGTPSASDDPLSVIDWINLFALAVNEENAAGGRIVTAPTNGAAGIIPAVLHYYTRFVEGANDRGVVDFLLTAAAIGMLFKKNASISGAEVGCQGEVGVACSMAAAGLCAVLGGTPEQVENAAEIGMEHHLGLTCDPIGGLVQIPCIERNALASVKAVNAARMALHGDGVHQVSLDQVIKTMRETGADMSSKYKETSLGGLAVNIIAC